MLIQHVIHDIRRLDCGERGVRGRLPHDDVADDESIPRPDHAREVEGGYHADDAIWMPLLIQPVERPFAGDCLAIELAGKADGKVAYVDHLLHFAPAFDGRLPHLQRNQESQTVDVSAQAVADRTHDFAALWRRNQRPLSKGRPGPFHQQAVVGCPGDGDIGQPRTIDGRMSSDAPPTVARTLLPVVLTG